MVAGEDDGSFGGDVLASDHFDSAEERVHHQTDEPHENPIGPTDRAHDVDTIVSFIRWGSAPHPGSVARGGPEPRSASSRARMCAP